MDYLTDTTFLIDMWRERGKPCAALRFVEKNGQAVCGLPWIAKGEFLRGAWLAGHIHDSVEAFLNSFLVVLPTEATVRHYAELYLQLRKVNALIGPNDLWLAACALERKLPLLTRNAGEFARVKGLTVVDYSVL